MWCRTEKVLWSYIFLCVWCAHAGCLRRPAKLDRSAIKKQRYKCVAGLPRQASALFTSFSLLDPTAWGWKLHDGCLLPIASNKEIAPPDLLKVIRYKCKASSKNQCRTNICTCKKHGLKCMSACSGCQGEDCNNKAVRV